MMAAVFLMQPLGQLISQLVGLCVLLGYGNTYNLQGCTDQSLCAPYVDGIWRWVTGVGAIPAAVAIYYRFKIKDPGLYDLDVRDKGERAVRNTERIYPGEPPDDAIEMQDMVMSRRNEADPDLPVQFSRNDIRDYFWDQGNWRSLLGTSLCWFFLDL
jgi:MFS transporter, PHS family, inorganic phosphate transporter